MNEIELNQDLKNFPILEYEEIKIEILDYNKIMYNDFYNNVLLRNQPCLIKNVSLDWECTNKWIENNKINFEYLSYEYGNLEAPVADCGSIKFNAQTKSIMTVGEYISYLKNASNRKELLYLKDWHLRRLRPKDNFYDVPTIFGSDWLNEFATDNQEDDFMFVYIGPKDSWYDYVHKFRIFLSKVKA